MTQARIFKLTLCLLVSLAAVGLAAMSVQRKVESFQPLGFSALPIPGATAGLLQVQQVSDARSGLQTGDQILLVDGAQASSAPALLQRLRQKPQAELAVMRGTQVLAVHYQRPPLVIDFPYLILALVGAFYLLIGLFILVQQREGQGGLFYLWCLASALLYLLTPTPPVDGVYATVYLVDQLAHTFLPPLTLHLFLVFPMPFAGIAPRRLRQLIAFAYLPAAVLAALQADLILLNGRFLFGPHNAAALKAFDRIDLLHLTTFALGAVGLLAYRLMRGHGWEQRRQLQWVAFGVAGGYLPFLLLYVLPFSLFGPPPMLLTTISVVPLALLPLSFAYAILRYKLWDIGVIVRGTISLTLTLLLGGIGFSLANLAITHGISSELPGARAFLSFVSGLAIAGLLVPTRQTLSSVFERLQYRGTFGKRRALSQLGNELLQERDLGRLCSALIDRIAEGVEVDKANLYLAQEDSLLPVRAEAGLPPILAGDALGTTLWESNFERFTGVELPGGTPSAAHRLFVAGYRYAFPLTVRGRGVGIALAGFKSDQMPLNSDDILLIRHLLNQAALAIENAQLVGQLQSQLEEMQSLKSYSDGIFESSPAGIAVVDEEQRLISVNPAFVHLAAVAGPLPGQSLIGRAMHEVLPLATLPEMGEAPIETSFCDPSGGEHTLQISLAEFRGGRRSLMGRSRGLRILVVHDVSERVEMERAMKENDRLAALGMLAAGVAHEVNTPITGISSYAQMLLSDTAESDPHYLILKKVERQTFRASRIVNNLLELARDRQKERRPVSIVPLIDESLDLLSDRLESRRIALEWTPPTVDGAAAIEVLGCDGELQQVFTNLIINAVDAMSGPGAPGAGNRLAIGVEADLQSVRVKVADSGPGIPADRLASIFEPFVSTKLHRGGTGLGLTISHDIVQRHGGTLVVASNSQEGACFSVELPRHRAPKSA